MVFTSDDGKSYRYAGELINEAVDQSTYVVHTYKLAGIKASGRFVRLLMVRGGFYVFCREVEIFGTESCECQVAETANGGLIINARNHWWRSGMKQEWAGKRIIARSSDGGQTWSTPTLDAALIEPTCHASLLRYSWPGAGTKSRLLFANPAATPTANWGGPRYRLTVRLSYDDGRTWPVSRLIEPGTTAYSALARLPDGQIGVLYESGGYGHLTFTALELNWLAPNETTEP